MHMHRHSSHLLKILIIGLVITDFILLTLYLLHQSPLQLLMPAGLIAQKEKELMLFIMFLGGTIISIFLVAVYLTLLRYRESNTSAKHSPDLAHHKLIQAVWWIFPSIIVLLISLTIWRTSHELDPRKPIPSQQSPYVIQVVALQWKWLFMYPEEEIATLNYVVFPVKRPIEFQLTADAPMNSFWIPRLGGQLYAMEGMINRLNLIADQTGEYPGQNAEISGEGFASMRFMAKAVTEDAFLTWVEKVRDTSDPLDTRSYAQLAKPSENTKQLSFSPIPKDLYTMIVMKYMPPLQSGENTKH